MTFAPRRVTSLGVLTTIILLLILTHYMASSGPFNPTTTLGKFASSVDEHVQDLLQNGEIAADDNIDRLQDQTNRLHPDETEDSNKGNDEVGKHVHVRPSQATSKDASIKTCEYPIVVHVTPDVHCTGALALYGSIIRNVLLQPDQLQNKTCVHFTYVDPDLKTIEAMYKWPARDNPFTHVEDCAALDDNPRYNRAVPVRWQALKRIEKPAIMEAGLETWMAALNKVHSWGFDLYPRILILDADSIILTDLHLIFQETSTEYTIAGAPDQFWNCNDRARLNGGMILLRPSRYFHISAVETLYDPHASCVSGKWEQSEQELLNCICGYNVPHALTPEFRCAIMPMYNSVWPKNYGCSHVNVVPMRSIHFTATPKPWTIEKDQLDLRFDTKFWHCVGDAAISRDLEALKECSIPELEVTRNADVGQIRELD